MGRANPLSRCTWKCEQTCMQYFHRCCAIGRHALACFAGHALPILKVVQASRQHFNLRCSSMQVKTGHFRALTHATTNLAARFQDVRSGSWMLEAEVGHSNFLPATSRPSAMPCHSVLLISQPSPRIYLRLNLLCMPAGLCEAAIWPRRACPTLCPVQR